MSRTRHALLELTYDKSLLTSITNSDLYKSMYADAKDGWYGPTAGRFKLGAQAGVTLFDGFSVTERLNPFTVPFYFNFSTAYQL